MEYKGSTEFSKAHCESVIRNSVDFYSLTLDGGELVGWIKKGLFSISVSRGMLKSDLVRNKVLGKISTKNNKTYVYFRTYRGYTDIVSILTICMTCFIGLSIVDISVGGGIPLWWKIIIPLFVCFFIAAISWIISHASEDGQENEQVLVEFLQKGLELTDENDSNEKSL